MSGRNKWPPPTPAPRIMYVQWAVDSYESTHSTHRIDPTDVAYVRLDVVEEAVRAAFEECGGAVRPQWIIDAVMGRLVAQHDYDQPAKSDGDGPPKQDPSDLRQRLNHPEIPNSSCVIREHDAGDTDPDWTGAELRRLQCEDDARHDARMDDYLDGMEPLDV